MQIETAVNNLSRPAQSGQVYVHCKLGYTRSTTVVVARLIRAGLADNVEQALAAVRQARPQIVLREQTIAALTHWAARYGKTMNNRPHDEQIIVILRRAGVFWRPYR